MSSNFASNQLCCVNISEIIGLSLGVTRAYLTRRFYPPPPKKNGAIVRTDTVRTSGYLQNFETSIIN